MQETHPSSSEEQKSDDRRMFFQRACERVAKFAGQGAPEVLRLNSLAGDKWERFREIESEIGFELGELAVELAQCGDVAALARAADPSVIVPIAWHYGSVGWQKKALEVAPLESLPGLTQAWILPGLAFATHQGHVSIAQPWVRELAEAVGRDTSGACRNLAVAALPELTRPESGLTIEDVNQLLGAMIGRVSPNDFQIILNAGSAVCDPEHIPTFASRIQGHFEMAFEEWNCGRDECAGLTESQDQKNDSDMQGRRQRWAQRGRPARLADMIEHARTFLSWCTQQDLSASEIKPAARVISLWRPMLEYPDLAPEIALLAKRWGGGLDPVCPTPSYNDLNAGIGVFNATGEGDREVLRAIKWEGRPFGPVEQALFAHSLKGAQALIKAGFGWHPESFQTLCAGLCELPHLTEMSTFTDGRVRVRHAAALGEKIDMEHLTPLAPSQAPFRI